MIVSVCCILVLVKYIQDLCFVPLVIKCRMHPNKYGDSFHFFCILLLILDVSRCILKTELFVLRFRLSDWSVPLTVSSVESTLWGLLIYHNIEIFQQFSGVFFDYCHPIFQLLFFLIASGCFFHRWVVSRCMVIPGFFWSFLVGISVVLQVHTLSFKVGLCLFNSPTSVISQFTIFLPSLWLPCIYILALISGVMRDLFPNILPQNHQLPR